MDRQMNEQTLQVGDQYGGWGTCFKSQEPEKLFGLLDKGPTAAPQQLLVESWPALTIVPLSGKFGQTAGTLAQPRLGESE